MSQHYLLRALNIKHFNCGIACNFEKQVLTGDTLHTVYTLY